MDNIDESLAGCNFPEMLVRDLEASEVVFRARSMTAGCPTSGLELPSDDELRPLPGRVLSRPPSPRLRPHVDRLPPNSLVVDRPSRYGELPDDDEQLDDKSELSRSMASSVDSGMEPPPSIRMRGHSITTAATSVSGRRSSSFSHKLNMRSLPSSQPSSPITARHQGSWFDADADAEADAKSMPEMSGALVARVDSHRSNCRQSRDSVGSDGGFHHHSRPESLAERPATANYDRPSTSLGHTLIERAHIVNIPPRVTPKRRSSLSGSHLRTFSDTSTSVASLHEAAVMNVTGHYGQHGGADSDMRQTCSASMHTRALSNGNTLVNVSRPSSGDPDGQDQEALCRYQSASPLPEDISETICVEEEAQQTTTEGYFEPIRMNTYVATTSLDRWAGTNGQQPSGSRLSAALLPPCTTPGIPLPPDVIETLRVSVSCFPETMLLTTSLSIETIRAYSKKLKHRGNPDTDFHHDDPSFYSSAESAPQPQKKRRHHWFGDGHWNKLQPGYFPRPLSSMNTRSPAPDATRRSTTTIKNIFPIGSDHLCDALYAHVLAYNYVGTLCPSLQVSRPQHPSPGFQSHRPSGSSMDDRNYNTQIPKKAASVLGIQDITSNHVPPPPITPQRSGSRRLLSKHNFDRILPRSRSSSRADLVGPRQGSSSAAETPGMRDLHAGLAKCITLLLATLTETETPDFGDGGDTMTLLIREREVHGESGDAYGLLMRALCEVVRAAEA